MAEKKVNLSIHEGGEFFAHELSINYNPTQFVFDYKCITPRVDPRSQESPIVAIKHNVILADPYHAKKMHELLGKILDKYEKDYGKIEKPKAMKAFEKKHKKKKKGKDEEDNTKVAPNYFG